MLDHLLSQQTNPNTINTAINTDTTNTDTTNTNPDTTNPDTTTTNTNTANNTTAFLLPVDIVGNTSTVDGASLDYFGDALRGVNRSVTVDVGEALGVAVGDVLGALKGAVEGTLH